MGRSAAAPVAQPSIIAPDSNTWRPAIMQTDSAQQSRTRKRSGVGKPAPRDMPIETILNDRLG